MSSGVQQYQVVVEREGATKAVARTRNHILTLNAEKGRGEAGFNAVETLMAALGACLMTGLNSLAAKMKLDLAEARLQLDATRLDDPPGVNRLNYTLTLVSAEPEEKLRQLHDLAVKWGTVANTLSHGIQPVGEVRIEKPSAPLP